MPAPTTPGRRRGPAAEKEYVPFNARPKEVGTFTGKPMPKNVPRNSDGFEDPDEFFKSPNDAPHTRSLSAALTRTPGGRRINPSTPGTGGTVGTTRSMRRGGRMSQLEDGDSGEEFAADLLVDDDEVDIGPRATPGPFFADTNPPPSVSLPRRSQVAPASPSVDYDTIPSPSKYPKRKSTIGVAYSSTPNTSAASASRKLADVTGMGDVDIEDVPIPPGMDEMDDDDVLASQSVQARPSTARQSTAAGARGDEEEEADDSADQLGDMTVVSAAPVEEGRDAEDRMSISARRSIGRRTDIGDDDEADADVTTGNVTGLAFDEHSEHPGFDDDGDDDEGNVPFQDSYGGDVGDDMDGEMGGDVHEDVEERIHDEDGEEEEEEEEVRPQPKKRGRPPKAEKAKQQRRERATSSQPRQVPAVTKRSRASGIGMASDENQYDGDFQCRRSGRRHFAPLAWWRGERFEYRRGNVLPEISEVVHVAPEPTAPLGAARNNRARTGRSGRSVSVRPSERGVSVVATAPEEGWDDGTDPIGLVRDFATGSEVHRRIALPRAHLNPKQVKDHDFMYQKIFGEDVFIASGVVFIPVGGSKPGKPSKDNSYVFYVISGAVQVVVHKTSFVMSIGGQFMVPRGNHYSIENVSPNNEAQLFFAQARKIRAHEEDKGRASVAPSEVPTPASMRKKSAVRRNEEEDEEEEEEEEVQPVKRRKAIGARR